MGVNLLRRAEAALTGRRKESGLSEEVAEAHPAGKRGLAAAIRSGHHEYATLFVEVDIAGDDLLGSGLPLVCRVAGAARM